MEPDPKRQNPSIDGGIKNLSQYRNQIQWQRQDEHNDLVDA